MTKEVKMSDVYSSYLEDIERLEKENKRLKEQLEIAKKALKEYADRTNWVEGIFMCVYNGECFADEEFATMALKEIDVKESK